MTSKTFAATAFAAIVLFSSCDWLFGKKENPKLLFPSASQWKLDSMSPLKDTGSSANGLQHRAVNAYTLKDSLILLFRFAEDSVLETTTQKDTSQYKYYADAKKQQIFIKEDSAYIPYRFVANDSSLQLIAADSSTLFLAKVSKK